MRTLNILKPFESGTFIYFKHEFEKLNTSLDPSKMAERNEWIAIMRNLCVTWLITFRLR